MINSPDNFNYFQLFGKMLNYLFILGIIVEAMTGALSAGRKEMDMMGAIIIAVVTALGGGTVRDIVLGHYPLTWVQNPHYLVITIIAGLLTICYSSAFRKLTKVFLILDALGLATFAVIGTKIALSLHLHPLIVVVIAMLNGICGGMLRDILCNDVPLILRKELYAIVAIFASITYIALSHLFPSTFGIELITIVLAFLLRLLAIYRHWEVPKFSFDGIVSKQ